MTEVDGFLTIDLKKGYTGVVGSGAFTYLLGSFDEVVDIEKKLPEQTMILRSYRVQMKDANEALRARVLHIDAPFLSSTQIINNLGRPTLPIELDNSLVTLRDGLHKPVYLSKVLEAKFKVRVLNDLFELETQINSISLNFETTKSVLK